MSVKLNEPVVELKTGGNKVHVFEIRLVVHSTWNKSFFEADHRRVTLLVVAVALVMTGVGRTKTVKALVAPAGGKPSSVTTVVNVNALPASAGPGVQVIMPLVVIRAFVAGVGKSARL